MSRRKQSNPKPLNKGDCADTTEEMTVDSRDSKDSNSAELLTHSNHSEEEAHDRSNSKDMEKYLEDSEITETSTNDVMLDENEHKVVTSNDNHEETQHSSNSPHSNGIHSPKQESEPNEMHVEVEEATSVGAVTPKLLDENSNSPMHISVEEHQTQTPIPKLRLNALLASDPALKPDARDLKTLHEETQTKNRANELAKLKKSEAVDHSVVDQVSPTVPKNTGTEVVAPRLKVFMCVPCGIGFSSFSTLEAHQAYYCSHRNKEVDEEASSTTAGNIAERVASQSVSPTTSINSNSANTAQNLAAEPAAKALKTGKQYACTQCSYSADKKVSLNRHMRMHQTSPAPSPTASNSGYDDNLASQNDRYCSECDIRFNTVKTYRAHKQHYCSSRRTDGQVTPKLEVNTVAASKTPNLATAVSPQTRTKTPTPAMVAAAALLQQQQQQQVAPQPFLALPTNPILIIPYSLIRAASLIPGPLPTISPGVVNPEATCFTLDNNALKPLATALNITGLNANNSSASAVQLPCAATTPTPSETLLTEKNRARPVEANESTTAIKRKENPTRESAPLDLSLRRSPITANIQRQRLRNANAFIDAEQQRLEMESLLEAGKENVSLDDSGSMTPEQIVCAPSLPNSPSMSPSPKRRTMSPRSSGAGSTASMSPPALLPQPSAAATAFANASSLLDSLSLRSLLPADIALKFSESNIINPLLAKQNLELALKLSAAVNSANAQSSTTQAELAAAAAAAVANKSSLLGLAPVLPSAAVPAAAPTAAPVQPQIYVKQGVSKCKECNIVFCKYENYLAHKQHYCSARNQESNDGEPKTLSNTPPNASGASPPESSPVAYQQLICAACGIKYTSLDNLRAHQNYYCPKGGGIAAASAAAAAAAAAATAATNVTSAAELPPQLPLPKEKCSKCKCVHEIGLPCPPPTVIQQTPPNHIITSGSVTGTTTTIGNQNFYKCPVCDAVSLTSSESRKHMETHGTVKAFRCTICRYKGNTLRGMRTHIRMHFDKKTSDVNEEHYMTCILEDEGIEIPSAATLNQEQLAQQIAAVQQKQQQKQLQQQAAAAAATAAVGLQQQQQQQQLYNCDICNYSSTYKGNVLRHMKLVHPQIPINSPSISPNSQDNENYDQHTVIGAVNGDTERHMYTTIKSEPMDHSMSMAQAALNDNNNSPNIGGQTRTSPTDYNAMPHIKAEPIDVEATAMTNNAHARAKLSSPNLVPTTGVANTVIPITTPGTDNTNAMVNQKYCETCDIPFNFMKTYLAHKQFYCKNKVRRPETNDSPSPHGTMQSPNALLLQKNKENMQQGAAI